MNILSAITPKSEVAVLDGNDTLRMAIEKMSQYRYSLLPVIGSQGHYLYSIGTSDILFYLASRDLTIRDMESIPLGSVPIYRPLMALPVTAGEEEVIQALYNQNFVPFVDERGIFIGIVTRRKFFEALTKKD